jgi:predicted GH43/DUF377 family glycosyl hydrolase
VFRPSGQHEWMLSHGSNPLALPLADGTVRVYFSCRDERNRSHVGFVELDPRRPAEILRIAEKPALAPGPLGYFDDHGTYAMSLVEHDGRLLLYYVGWNPGPRPFYYPSVGLAVSDNGGESFERFSNAPIMARSEVDPWMVSSPFVMLDEGRWRMWYLSGLGWREEEDGLNSYYHTKYAESDDGVNWKREGRVALELRDGERNIARMSILRDEDRYRAWYPYNRGEGYRIGYAESDDGYAWTRKDDEAGIAPSESGWDSEATAYPWVFDHRGTRYMLYSGNRLGQAGFGLAEAA